MPLCVGVSSTSPINYIYVGGNVTKCGKVQGVWMLLQATVYVCMIECMCACLEHVCTTWTFQKPELKELHAGQAYQQLSHVSTSPTVWARHIRPYGLRPPSIRAQRPRCLIAVTTYLSHCMCWLGWGDRVLGYEFGLRLGRTLLGLEIIYRQWIEASAMPGKVY